MKSSNLIFRPFFLKGLCRFFPLILFYSSFPSLSFSQMHDPFSEQGLESLRKNFEKAHERMQRLFQQSDDLFKNLEETFFNEGFDSFFKHEGAPLFGNILKGASFQTKWRETKESKILILKGLSPEQKNALKISVKNGKITLSNSLDIQKKGHQFRSQELSEFHYSISAPPGIDPRNVKVEHKKEEVHLIFPKVRQGSIKGPKAIKEKRKQSPQNHPPGTLPLSPGDDGQRL